MPKIQNEDFKLSVGEIVDLQDDFDQYLQDCVGLTCLLLTARVNTVHPTLIEAIVLADAAYKGIRYQSPFGAEKKRGTKRAVPLRQRLQFIKDRVDELRRWNVDFIFIWHFADEAEIHEEVSKSYAHKNHYREVVELFAEGLRERMAY